jgi:hypothetical protein
LVREPVMVIVKVEGSLMLLVTQASDNVKSELSLVKVTKSVANVVSELAICSEYKISF